VCVSLMVGGFSAFCASVAPQVNASDCDDLLGFSWERYPEASNFYDDVILAQTAASFVVAGWMIGFVILIILVINHEDFRVIGPDRKASSSPSTTASVPAAGVQTSGGSTPPTTVATSTNRTRTHTMSNSSNSPSGSRSGSGSSSTATGSTPIRSASMSMPSRPSSIMENRPLLSNNGRGSSSNNEHDPQSSLFPKPLSKSVV